MSVESKRRSKLAKVVVLDVDGTLMDTNYLHTEAWARHLRARAGAGRRLAGRDGGRRGRHLGRRGGGRRRNTYRGRPYRRGGSRKGGQGGRAGGGVPGTRRPARRGLPGV